MPEKQLTQVISEMASDQKKLEKTAEEIRKETRSLRECAKTLPTQAALGAA